MDNTYEYSDYQSAPDEDSTVEMEAIVEEAPVMPAPEAAVPAEEVYDYYEGAVADSTDGYW